MEYVTEQSNKEMKIITPFTVRVIHLTPAILRRWRGNKIHMFQFP